VARNRSPSSIAPFGCVVATASSTDAAPVHDIMALLGVGVPRSYSVY
jgi:hypothetical protein